MGLLSGMVLCIQPPFIFSTKEYETDSTNENIVNKTDSANPDTDPTIHNENYFFGATMALACALCGSLSNVLISKCQNVASTTLVLVCGLFGVLIGVVGCYMEEDSRILFDMEAMDSEDWLELLVISAIGILAYFAMTLALKSVSPTSVSVLRALEIVMAYACQIIMMGEFPNWICLVGAGLVMFSVVGLALDEKFSNRNNGS